MLAVVIILAMLFEQDFQHVCYKLITYSKTTNDVLAGDGLVFVAWNLHAIRAGSWGIGYQVESSDG